MKYIAFDSLVQFIFMRFNNVSRKISAPQMNEIIREEFVAHGDCSAMAAFLFNLSNLYELHLRQLFNSESGIKN